MIASVTLKLLIPPELTAKLAERAAENGVSSDKMAERIILEAVEAAEAAETPPSDRQPIEPGSTFESKTGGYTACTQGDTPERNLPPAETCLDIARLLTPEECRRLDDLALRNGASPEALAAATMRRLLRRTRSAPQTFRLKMPEKAKQKLQEHAQALGCGAGELAAFLFSKRGSRPQATLAGG